MECPHCHYTHGWSNELCKSITGHDGEFYKLPIKLERNKESWGTDEEYLYACPSCYKTFIDKP
jgi:hypothetical protein